MSMLCKSSTSKYVIMVRNVIDKFMKNMIKLFKNIYIYIKFKDYNSILTKKLSRATHGSTTSSK